MKPKFALAALMTATFAFAGPALVSAAAGKGEMAQNQKIAALAPGQEVTLRGVVLRITDEDEFILSDASGQIPVYVGPNMVPATQGETITVSGRVDDDFPREIYATLIIRADGTQVPLPHRY
ncbi:NirD/YgiW/YdeI family stress tolerance protein [Roseicyclus sp.]|uniref:NirD/YgiW/YdeI family stress tolerance protein n=1 Tax=Roseicyclus sp. TaxID=1914329 RepID=UPI003F6CB966